MECRRRVFRNWSIHTRKNTVSERIGCAHVGGRAAVRDRCPRVVSPGSRAHMTRVHRLNHVLCIRTVIRSDRGRGFWSLLGENGWRECERVKIGAFSCVPRVSPNRSRTRKTESSPTVASWKTIKRLVSSIHLILNPPPTASHSPKATWISLVFSSLGNPVRDRMRVTQAESWVSDEAMVDNRSEVKEVKGQEKKGSRLGWEMWGIRLKGRCSDLWCGQVLSEN